MNEKDFKKDIILFKNKKYKELKSYKKVKSNKIDSILLYMRSSLYGYSYINVNPKTYNKFKNISNIKFSYRFLDGQLVDDEDIDRDDIWIKNVFYYDDIRDLMAKLYEIYMAELCLNDNFWVFDAYYAYLFRDYKISFTYTTKKHAKKLKFNDIVKFYKFIFDSESLFNKNSKNLESLVSFSTKRYKNLSNKDIKKESKLRKFIENNKDNRFIKSMNNNQYTDIDPKFLKKYKSITVDSLLYVSEFDENDPYIQNNIHFKYQDYDIEYLYKIACSPIVISNLESNNISQIFYYIKNKIFEINNKKLKGKKKKKFKYILKKYFPGIKYGLL